MIRKVFATAAAVLVLASPAAAAPVSDPPEVWKIEAEEGVCTASYGSREQPDKAAIFHGFSWAPDEGVSFFMIDQVEHRAAPKSQELAMLLTGANGTRLQAYADRREAEELQSYTARFDDRKDLATMLSGDVTYTYADAEGADVVLTVPYARQLPRIRRCMAEARAQAKILAEQGGPARQAKAPSRPEAAAPEEPEGPKLIGSGSGVFVNNRGQLVTNAHVIEGCTVVGNEAIGPGKLIAVDPSSDLALLQFKEASRGFASFRPDNLRLGESVIAAGFPLSDLLANGLNVTTGNVSALSGLRGDRRLVQITAPVQPGNSGGPLLDASGRLVGIVSSGLRNEALGEGRDTAQNVNWAVAPFIVRAFLQEHGVRFSEARESRETTETVAAKARSHTVRLECWG